MKAQVAYSIKDGDTLALRAFNSKRSALRYGNGQTIFATPDDLIKTKLHEDKIRKIYYAVTGKPTKASDRIYLCELTFNAIKAAKIPTVEEVDFSISIPEEIPEKEKVMPVVEVKSKKKEPLRVQDSNSNDPVVAYGVHPDSKRADILRALIKAPYLSISQLTKLVYGNDAIENYGRLKLVIKGLLAAQEKYDLPWEVNKFIEGKEIRYEIKSK